MIQSPIFTLTLTVGAATVLAQRFVGFDGQHAAADADALGVADYDGEPDAAIAVNILGTAKVVAGAAFSKGDKLKVGVDGKVIAQGGAGEVVAKAMEDAAGDGQIVEVLLTP